MEKITQYIPLNFAILANPYNWFVVFGLFVFFSICARLITSDDFGNSTADNSAS